jgi:hypothetical protein
MRTESFQDEINILLRECEDTLRVLREQGRLSGAALQAFTVLSANLREELERRRCGDRRTAARKSPDRRLTTTVADQLSVA